MANFAGGTQDQNLNQNALAQQLIAGPKTQPDAGGGQFAGAALGGGHTTQPPSVGGQFAGVDLGGGQPTTQPSIGGGFQLNPGDAGVNFQATAAPSGPAVGGPAKTPDTSAAASVAPAAGGQDFYGKGAYQGGAADFSKLGHGDAVQGMDGYSWYHTGALGGADKYGGSDWIQAKTGSVGGGQPAPPSGGAPGATQAPPQDPIKSAFNDALKSRLSAGPVDAKAPELQGVLGANRAAEQRGFERNRALMAERAAAQGLDPAAMSSQVMGLAQDRAGRESQFEGGQVANLANRRAQELTAALSLGGNMLNEQDRMALQKELAQLQAQIQREGTAAQVGLGQGDLALRGELGRGQLNLGLLGTLLQNQQFGQGLGAQMGQFNASMNQNALLQALGML